MVERGGLEYPISVPDNFSANIEAFNRLINKAKREWAGFIRTVEGTTTPFRRLGTQLNNIATNVNRAATAVRNQAQAIRQSATAATQATQAQREQIAISKQSAREAAKLGASYDAQSAAVERQIKATKRLATTEALLRQGRGAQGLTPQEEGRLRFIREISRLESQLEFERLAKGDKRLQSLRRELDLTRESGNRAAFTFRRLIGILAAFTIARVAVGQLRELVVQGIQFNSTLEQTVLGISAVLTATGELADAQGNNVSQARQFALAQEEARRQTELLRVEALRTAATFEQVSFAFQTAIAPGRQAGLPIDEIRRFSISISQAAAAIGLEQQQLAEEIRSLLQGTINLRTTRIASALNITNEDIRAAKELGVLGEFLAEQFSAFGVAADASLDTFAVRATNARDALSQLVASGSIEFFEELKALLGDVNSILVDLSNERVEINPDAIAVVQGLSEGLRSVIEDVRELRDNLSFRDLIAPARALGEIISTVSDLTFALVEVLVTGFGRALSIASLIIDTFRSVAGTLSDFLPLDQLRSFIQQLLSIGVTIGAIVASVGGLARAFTLLNATVNFITFGFLNWKRTLDAVKNALAAIRVILATISAPVLIIVASFTAIIAISKQLLDDFHGMELTLGTIVGLVRTGLVAAFRTAMVNIRIGWIRFTNFLETTVENAINTVVDAGFASVQTLLELAGNVSDSAEQAAQVIQFIRREREAANAAEEAARERELQLTLRRLQAERELIRARRAAEGRNILNRNEDNFNLTETIQGLIGDISNAISEAFDSDAATENAITSINDLFDSLPGTIGLSSNAIKNLEARVKQLNDELMNSEDELKKTLETIGLSGDALALRTSEIETQNKLFRDSSELLTEIADAQANIAVFSERQNALAEESKQLGRENAFIIQEALNAYTDISKLEDERLKAQLAGNGALAAQFRALTEERRAYVDLLQEGLDPADAERILSILQERLTVDGELAANQAALNRLREQETALTEQYSQLLTNEILAASAQAVRDSRELTNQLRIRRNLATTRNVAVLELTPLREQLVVQRGLVDAKREEIRLLERQRNENLASLRISLLNADNDKQRVAIADLYNSSLITSNAQLALANTELDGMNAKLQALTQEVEGGDFASGLQSGFFTAAEELSNLTNLGRRIGTTLATDITGDLIETISDTDKEWEDFFENFTRTISEMIAQAALLRLTLAGLGAIGLGAGVAGGGATGGLVTGANTVQQFAKGGSVLPMKGRDPRDRIPVLARVGEAMIRPEQAKRHMKFLSLLNAGRIPEAVTKMITSGMSGTRMATPKSFATGGIATERAALEDTIMSAQSASNAPQVLPVVVADKDTLDKLLAASPESMFEFLRTYRDNSRASLEIT